MPALALPAFWGAVGATATGAGLVAGAKIQSGGAQKGAQIQSDAALQAAKIQAEANDKAQATLRAQQAQDLAIADSTQHANYNQWAAREGRMSDFGAALGLAPRNIPAYQPIPGAANSGPAASSPAAAGQAWTPDFIRQQLQQTGQDPSEQNIQYFLGKENELKAREAQLNQPGYALWRVRDPNSGKSGATMPSSGYANSYATMNATSSPLVLTPALQQPNSFAQFMSR